MDYKVVWVVEIEADTPLEAARQAQEIQRDPQATATVFEVYAENGKMTPVDLLHDADSNYASLADAVKNSRCALPLHVLEGQTELRDIVALGLGWINTNMGHSSLPGSPDGELDALVVSMGWPDRSSRYSHVYPDTPAGMAAAREMFAQLVAEDLASDDYTPETFAPFRERAFAFFDCQIPAGACSVEFSEGGSIVRFDPGMAVIHGLPQLSRRIYAQAGLSGLS